MQVHRNAALGLAGRLKLVQLVVAGGLSQREAARRMGVSPATANRWVRRWREADVPAQATRACLGDRSSRPQVMPRLCAPDLEARILAARLRTHLGPGRLAGILGIARSTIWKVLHRLGASRAPRAPRPATRRYEWQRAGALIHVDVARLARPRRPGHRVRTRHEQHRSRGAGQVYVHVAVDDRSRYAYVEQHPDERAATCGAFLGRALRHFAELGMAAPEAVMTDNAFAYVHGAPFAQILRGAGARHITTPPYTPRWNGKAERFIQTLKREMLLCRVKLSAARSSRGTETAVGQPRA
jgi:transposase